MNALGSVGRRSQKCFADLLLLVARSSHSGRALASMASQDGKLPRRVSELNKPSVWLEFTPLARATEAINLGQGFPDWAPPEFVQKAAVDAFQDPLLARYSTSRGHPRFLSAVAKEYSSRFNCELDASKNVLSTVGASQGIYLAMHTFVEEGDEVVVIEPAFDLYMSNISMVGAVAKFVPLRSRKKLPDTSADLHIDMDELESVMSDKTRMLILNSPHNPTGKAFTHEEFDQIARLLDKYPSCLVLSDEVYEHLVYDGRNHLSFASIDGMWDRTITLFSIGKTFSVTGWKLGWAVGPASIVQRMVNVQQHIVFCVSTPIQEAAAVALEKAREPYQGSATYYEWLHDQYHSKRELLSNVLQKARLNPCIPEGGFFIICNISDVPDFVNEFPEAEKALLNKIDVDTGTLAYRDYNYCRWLTFTRGVTAIPPSAFYSSDHAELGHDSVRFAFCKADGVLKEAGERLLREN